MHRPSKKSIRQMVSIDEIQMEMCHVFQEAQLALSGHRKLVIIMKTLFDRANELGLLHEFAMMFTKLLNKILDLKRGEKTGDRIAKFCSTLMNTLRKGEEQRKKDEGKDDDDKHEEEDEEEDEEESPEDIFLTILINHLLRGVRVKDKNVRYRVVQILGYIVYYIGELDRVTFQALYTSLSESIYDREPYVRIQAIVALSRFQLFDLDSEIGSDNDDIEINQDLIIKNLTSCLIKDDSAEVRRAALLNLSKTNKTIPLLIKRARDVNNINRRLVYSRISRELGSFQTLKPVHIENLLTWGLNDRETSVRDSAIKMLSIYWYESANEDILQLIAGLNVTESEIAESAMSVFFNTRQDTLSTLKFNEQDFWKSLTVDKSFLMRTFYHHCNENKLYELIDSNFPEPLILANILENYFKLRSDLLSKNTGIVKNLKIYDNNLEELNDSIFAAENYLLRLNIDIGHVKILLGNDEKELKYNEMSQEALKAKIDGLDLEDLKIEVDEAFSQEIENLTERDLKKKRKRILKLVQENKDSIVSRKNLLVEFENEFNVTNEEYTNSGNGKIQEMTKRAAYLKEVHEFDTQLKDLEYVILQLLLVSKDFDFGDEMGRRKMLQLIRSSLSGEKLPDSITNVALKVLRNISINEKDFVSMATEIITDIRDSHEEDDTFHSAHSVLEEIDELDAPDNDDSQLSIEQSTPRSKRRRTEAKLPPDDIVIHCLMITQHLLEIMEEPLENNISLESIYSGLVNYAITCTEKYSLHLMGLKCLGLFSLIDVKIARNGCSTFYSELKTYGEKVRVIAIKALVDILSMYGVSIIENNGLHVYAKLLHRNLNEFSMPKLQCAAAEGLCKLFLAEVFVGKNGDDTEKELLESLVLAYFNPKTQSNNELRQILAFCLPVYAFSHYKHQYRIATVSGDALYRLYPSKDDKSKDKERETSFKDNKIIPSNVVQELIHWCDPNNLINLNQDDIKHQTSHYFQTIYFLQAIEQNTPKIVKKAIINNLSRMFITEELESKLLKSLVESIAKTRKVIENDDASSEFAFDKITSRNFDNFETDLKETLEKSLERERELEVISVASSRIPSRTNSNVNIYIKAENGVLSQNSSRNSTMVKEEDMEDLEKVMQSIEVNEDNEEDMNQEDMNQEDTNEEEEDKEKEEVIEDDEQEETNKKQRLIEENLKDIDQILENEDAVEYDISMEDI